MKNVVEVKNITKSYGNSNNNITRVLDDVTFSVKEGEFIGIMGSSGSGKTTLLNCIATIDKVNSGSVILDEVDISKLNKQSLSKFRQKNLGFIFQDYNLLDTLTIEENISLPLVINEISPSKIQKEVVSVSSILGIKDILQKFPIEVSGGQKQRCACARALISNPKLIVADEPTGALDTESSQVLMKMLKKINQEVNSTILIVTHDSMVASHCNRLLFLDNGKIFDELINTQQDQNEFHRKILTVLSDLGGHKNA